MAPVSRCAIQSNLNMSNCCASELSFSADLGGADGPTESSGGSSVFLGTETTRREPLGLDCINQLSYLSEDSNLSEPSHVSADSRQSSEDASVSGQASQQLRERPLPVDIKAFLAVDDAPSSNVDTNDETEMEGSPSEETVNPSDEHEANLEGTLTAGRRRRKLPSIEDFCHKETKTLNTNVLASEYMSEIVTLDSKKFYKPDNTNRPSTMSSVGSGSSMMTVTGDDDSGEMSAFEHLHDLLVCDIAKSDDANAKTLYKETNLVANCRNKFADDDVCGGTDEDAIYGKKLLFSELDAADGYNINNIKRIKIDDEEKNMRMQSKLKVNTEQNQTREPDALSSSGEAKVTNVGVMPIGSEQLLCAGGGASAASPTDQQQMMSLQRAASIGGGTVQCLNNEDHLWVRYVRSAEKSWLAYLGRNRSVIVDTFQGQFKSTVSVR